MKNLRPSIFSRYTVPLRYFSEKKKKHVAVWKALARVLYTCYIFSSLLIFLLMSKFLTCHGEQYHLPPYMRTYPL